MLYFDGKYVVPYACIDVLLDGSCSIRGQKLHVLSREKSPPDADMVKFDNIVRSACVDPTKLKRISHTGCTYFAHFLNTILVMSRTECTNSKKEMIICFVTTQCISYSDRNHTHVNCRLLFRFS